MVRLRLSLVSSSSVCPIHLAMLRDSKGYPFVSNVVHSLSIGRTAFHHHFLKERIRELRG